MFPRSCSGIPGADTGGRTPIMGGHHRRHRLHSIRTVVTPHSVTANPRHVVVGHLICVTIGAAFAVLDGTGFGVGSSKLRHWYSILKRPLQSV